MIALCLADPSRDHPQVDGRWVFGGPPTAQPAQQTASWMYCPPTGTSPTWSHPTRTTGTTTTSMLCLSMWVACCWMLFQAGCCNEEIVHMCWVFPSLLLWFRIDLELYGSKKSSFRRGQSNYYSIDTSIWATHYFLLGGHSLCYNATKQ